MRLDKLKAIRVGHRSSITKRVKDAEEATGDLDKVSVCVNAIERCLTLLRELDDKILKQTEIDEVENEIITAEDFTVSVELDLRKLQKVSQKVAESQSDPCRDRNANSHSNSGVV